MKQHTPGPWRVEFGCVYRVGLRGYGPDGDEMSRIALMDRDNPLTIPTERDANARLIAAAPELLKAGKCVIAAWLEATPGGNIAEISPLLGKLRAAIAKAETLYPRG